VRSKPEGWVCRTEEVRSGARNLWRNVCAQAQQSSGQLVDQLEGLQVEIVSGAGQQRLDIFQHRRHD
jgi:hypothetical protein